MVVTKPIVYFTFFLIFLSGLLYGALDHFVFSVFERTERDAARYALGRAVKAINVEGQALRTWVRDIAPWDETYVFAQDKDPIYIVNNFTPESLENLDFDVVLFADSIGSVIWSYVSESGNIDDLRYEELLHHVDQQWKWGESTGIVGLHRADVDSVYLVAMHPILTSEYGGPSKGTVIFGRKLDNARFEKMIESSVADFNLLVIGGESALTDFTGAIGGTSYSPELWRENGETKASILLRDFNNKAVLKLEVRAHRNTTKNGSEAINAVMYVYIVTVLLGLAGFFLISREPAKSNRA